MVDQRPAVELIAQKTQHPHRIRICRDTQGKDIWVTVCPSKTGARSVTGSHSAEGASPAVQKSTWDYNTRCHSLENVSKKKWTREGVQELFALTKCEYFDAEKAAEIKKDAERAAIELRYAIESTTPESARMPTANANLVTTMYTDHQVSS